MSRDRCLQAICYHLGVGELDRRFGLTAVKTLAQFRQAIGLMDLTTHAEQVESLLGFSSPKARTEVHSRSGGAYQREAVVEHWRTYLPNQPQPRILWLETRAREPLVDAIREDDLRALGSQPLRIERLADVGGPLGLLERLHSYQPQVLCLPSVYTLKWIESLVRAPLDRVFSPLQLVLAGADLRVNVRTKIPVVSAGLIHRAGRLTLPGRGQPAAAMELASQSTLLELRPHRPLAGMQADETVLPEQAIIGERYELVVSSALGFLRCRTDWHVRVVGFSATNTTPTPRVLHLPSPPEAVRLEGLSIPGAWLSAGVRQAFAREDPALLAAVVSPDPAAIGERPSRRRDHDPFSETELGRLESQAGRRHTGPRGLLAQIEVHGKVRGRLTGELAKRLDADLCRRSPAYAHLRARGELRGVRVVLVESGTFSAAKQRKVQALRGPIDLPQVRVSNDTSAPLYPSITHLPIRPP